MEQLAALVLNGEGRKLIGLTSDQPEIQAFLDNVPAYMVCDDLINDILFIVFRTANFAFRTKLEEFIWLQEKAVCVIYSRHWIDANLP